MTVGVGVAQSLPSIGQAVVTQVVITGSVLQSLQSLGQLLVASTHTEIITSQTLQKVNQAAEVTVSDAEDTAASAVYRRVLVSI